MKLCAMGLGRVDAVADQLLELGVEFTSTLRLRYIAVPASVELDDVSIEIKRSGKRRREDVPAIYVPVAIGGSAHRFNCDGTSGEPGDWLFFSFKSLKAQAVAAAVFCEVIE